MSKLRRAYMVLLGVCLLVAAGRVHAASGPKVVLVENGVSRAPIVVFKDAPPYTRLAADDLARYIEKTSGAKPKVIEGTPNPIPKHAVWVGYQPVLEKLFPKTDFDFKHPEEILIAANGKHLAIVGRDRWDPEHLVVIFGRRGKRKIVGKQQEYGTANAVYTFLQDNLGVRWFWPGELGEDVLKRKTIAFAPFEYRYHPQIRSRGGVFTFSKLKYRGYGRSHDWVRYQRLRLDSLELHGGHAFSTWWKRFHKTRPEYFALQPDGTRSGFPGPRTVKLCLSTPAVWKQWLADVEEQLKIDPNQTVFSAAPNDGWASGHCVCKNCRAWDHPKGEPRLFRWRGLGQEYVALSDRHVTFANKCARLLKERYPGKDYYVLMMSYGHSRPAPVKAVPADNVIMSSVANFLGRTDLKDRGSTWGTKHRDQFAAWAKVAPHIMWRPNTGSPAGWWQAQPDVSTTQVIKDFKFIAANKCIGIFIDGVWEHWATEAPQYYIMAQLTWNPGINAQAVLDDYYRRAFGAGADELKGYWSLLEKTRQAYVKGDREYWQVYDKALFGKAYGFLDRADKALAGKPEIYSKRVRFIRAGLDHSRLMTEVRELMARYWDSGGTDAEAKRKVLANWAAIEQNCKAHPHAMNWGPIRPQTPRMKGLHPKYPASRRKRKGGKRKAAQRRTDMKGVKLVPAAEAGWRLVLHDRFQRNSLGANWQALDGKWTVSDGFLRGSGTLISTRGFPGGGSAGFVRMEFEAFTDQKPAVLLNKASKSKGRASDMSSFIHAKPSKESVAAVKSGYFFQFGGYWNKRNQLTRAGTTLDGDESPKVRIRPGGKHRIVVENDRGRLRCFVNGRPILSFTEKSSLVGPGQDRVGFYFYTAAKVKSVKVYVKSLANDLDGD